MNQGPEHEHPKDQQEAQALVGTISEILYKQSKENFTTNSVTFLFMLTLYQICMDLGKSLLFGGLIMCISLAAWNWMQWA